MPKFNASEYQRDFKRLAEMNPGKAAETATGVARGKVNAANRQKNAADSEKYTKAYAYAAAVPVTALLGAVEGMQMAKRQAMIEDWEANGAASVGADLKEHPTPFTHKDGVKDPTKLFGIIPSMVVAPAVSGIGALVLSMKKKKGKKTRFAQRWMTELSGQTLVTALSGLAWGASFEAKRKKLGEAQVSSLKGGEA